MLKRRIELYDVDDVSVPISTYDADEAFMPLSKGDFFDPRSLNPDHCDTGHYLGNALQVVAVTHLLFGTGEKEANKTGDSDAKQSVLVYLKQIPGAEYERIIRGQGA